MEVRAWPQRGRGTLFGLGAVAVSLVSCGTNAKSAEQAPGRGGSVDAASAPTVGGATADANEPVSVGDGGARADATDGATLTGPLLDDGTELDLLSHWMERVFRERPTMRLRDMVIAGTHDAATYGITAQSALAPDGQAYYNFAKDIVAGWAKTQSMSLFEQLQHGVRHFDLRVARVSGVFVIVHGLVSVTVDDILTQVATWATAHPKEVVFLEFALLPAAADLPDLHALVMSRVGARMLPPTYAPNKVTIGDVWREGKNIIGLFDDAAFAGAHSPWWPIATTFHGTWANTTDRPTLKQRLEAGLDGQDTSQLFYSAVTFTETQNDVINGLTGAGPKTQLEFATPIRDAAGRWVPVWRAAGKKVNFITGDFFERTALVATAIAENSDPVPAPPQRLRTLTVTDMARVYDSQGSGARTSLTVFRPDTSKHPGCYSLGDVAGAGSTPPAGATLLRDPGRGALFRPLGYNLAWSNTKTGAPVYVWSPVAPAGYACLGILVTGTDASPAVEAMRCVHKSYLRAATPAKLWDDTGSGAATDVSLWVAQPTDAHGLATRNFRASDTHDDPGAGYWVISLDRVEP